MKRIVLLLLACFPSVFMLAQVPETYWIPDNVGQFNITLFAQLSLAGDVPNSQESPVANYELGVFDQDGKCCGVAFPPTWKNVRQRWVYSLAIQGETGSTYTFKIYDHATGQELPMACSENGDHYMFSVVEDPFSPYYGDGQTYGQPSGLTPGPDMLHFMSAQTIVLSVGWNWVSIYLENENPEEMMLTLQGALGENGLQIVDKYDFTTYADGEWGDEGELEELSNDKMYMIQTSAACTVELQGMPGDPADYPITIVPGWNWIGFPSSEAISIEDAFADFEAEDGDMIVGKYGYTTYLDGWGDEGDLEVLTPSEGYMYYYSGEGTKTLVISMPTSTAK